jgi:peptide/nickel transport system permease protein
MRRMIVRRLAGAVIQLFVVTIFAWLLFYVIARFTGASPAQRIAGKTATAAQVALVAKILGLSKPYWQQYLIFLGHLLHGNFGYSYFQDRPVSSILWPATRATASLVLGAAVIWISIAAPIGSYGGLRPRSHGTTLFPITGYTDFGQSPVQWAYHLVLPWVTLAIGFAAVYIRYIRTLTAEQLGEDYTRTAKAKGASTRRILLRHVGRNVAPTMTVLLGADVATALSGVFFVETVFNVPGLGWTGVYAIQNLDYPVITGVVIVAAFMAVLANTIVDLLHGVLDPRLRRLAAH